MLPSETLPASGIGPSCARMGIEIHNVCQVLQSEAASIHAGHTNESLLRNCYNENITLHE